MAENNRRMENGWSSGGATLAITRETTRVALVSKHLEMTEHGAGAEHGGERKSTIPLLAVGRVVVCGYPRITFQAVLRLAAFAEPRDAGGGTAFRAHAGRRRMSFSCGTAHFLFPVRAGHETAFPVGKRRNPDNLPPTARADRPRLPFRPGNGRRTRLFPAPVNTHRVWLVAYDIADAGRLARVACICLDYGVRVQKSLFECDIPRGGLRRDVETSGGRHRPGDGHPAGLSALPCMPPDGRGHRGPTAAAFQRTVPLLTASACR